MTGDAAGIKRVLLGLLQNALAAAGDGPGGVTVTVAREEPAHAVLVHIDDSSPGVPVDERARVFDPFFTTRPDGTGLGLTLARSVMVDHGGDLTVDDGPLGGARFTLRFPAVEP